MSQLGELLNKLAIQSGIDANDEGLKALLSNPTVSTYEVPGNIAAGIQNGLLTVESAKNNPTLKNHFFALAYNGLDSEIDTLANEFGIDEALKSELMTEKSSTKRAALLTRKVKELTEAKSKANNMGKEVIQAKLDELNNELKTIKETHAQEITNLNAKNRDGLKDLLVNNLLSAYNYSLPTSKDVSVLTAKQIIQNEIASKGAKVVLNDNNELVLTTNDGLDLFINNEKVSFKDLVDSTLATHKLLKTKDLTPRIPPLITGGGGKNAFLEAASKDAQQFAG